MVACGAAGGLIPVGRPPARSLIHVGAQRNIEKQKQIARDKLRFEKQAKADAVQKSVAARKKLQTMRDTAEKIAPEPGRYEEALGMMLTAQAGYAKLEVLQPKLDARIEEMQEYIEAVAAC